MRYLLDTHAALWYFENSGELSSEAEEIIDNPENDIFLSAASLWEIVLKVGLGKLDVSFDAVE